MVLYIETASSITAEAQKALAATTIFTQVTANVWYINIPADCAQQAREEAADMAYETLNRAGITAIEGVTLFFKDSNLDCDQLAHHILNYETKALLRHKGIQFLCERTPAGNMRATAQLAPSGTPTASTTVKPAEAAAYLNKLANIGFTLVNEG